MCPDLRLALAVQEVQEAGFFRHGIPVIIELKIGIRTLGEERFGPAAFGSIRGGRAQSRASTRRPPISSGNQERIAGREVSGKLSWVMKVWDQASTTSTTMTADRLQGVMHLWIRTVMGVA